MNQTTQLKRRTPTGPGSQRKAMDYGGQGYAESRGFRPGSAACQFVNHVRKDHLQRYYTDYTLQRLGRNAFKILTDKQDSRAVLLEQARKFKIIIVL